MCNLEINLPSLKIVLEKRQNFDTSTPPAWAYHLHFMLNRETRRAPVPPPDSSTQMAWEDVDEKVS
jgi:hypothetical protein